MWGFKLIQTMDAICEVIVIVVINFLRIYFFPCSESFDFVWIFVSYTNSTEPVIITIDSTISSTKASSLTLAFRKTSKVKLGIMSPNSASGNSSKII